MPVLMEDFDGLQSPYNCIAGLKYFLDSVEGLGCAFDTGNFAAFHEDELEAYELFADRIGTVHLKDRSPVPQHEGNTPFVCAGGDKVYACSIGSGTIRISDILQKLRDKDYRGNLIVELYACDPRFFMQDAQDSLRWLQSQPEALR
jgi:sugar phosphate isomerase/epimerase